MPVLGLWLNNTLSLSTKVHLGYFTVSVPFPSLQFVLVSISYHTAHQVSVSCRFFRASERTGSGTQSGSHIQQAQSKGQNHNQSRRGMAQQSIFTTANNTLFGHKWQPTAATAPAWDQQSTNKHLAIWFSQAEHFTAGCSSINVKCWLSKARLLNHNLTIYSLCRQQEYCTSTESAAASPVHACLPRWNTHLIKQDRNTFYTAHTFLSSSPHVNELVHTVGKRRTKTSSVC